LPAHSQRESRRLGGRHRGHLGRGHLGRTEIIVAATVLKANQVILETPCDRIFASSALWPDSGYASLIPLLRLMFRSRSHGAKMTPCLGPLYPSRSAVPRHASVSKVPARRRGGSHRVPTSPGGRAGPLRGVPAELRHHLQSHPGDTHQPERKADQSGHLGRTRSDPAGVRREPGL